MTDEKLKIVVLTHGGVDRVLELLSENEAVDVVHIFIETPVVPTRTLWEKVSRSIRYDGYAATATKFLELTIGGKHDAVDADQDDLKSLATELQIPITEVGNYHDASSIELIKNANADLGLLYGTNIIKESVFSIPRLGSINIHKGLAPVYRGGPPVFWELFNDEKEIGITVHYVAAKVDTGDIILQETMPLEYHYGRYDLDFATFIDHHLTSMNEPSARLVAKAVDQIATGTTTPRKQDASLGKRYRLPIKSEKDELLRRLKERRQK